MPEVLKSLPRLRFHVITLFPEFFESPLQASLLGKAVSAGLVEVNLIQLRDFAINRYGQVDDPPYGGGSGMVLMIEPLVRALESIDEPGRKILLTPRGSLWSQERCRELAAPVVSGETLTVTLICGHYEGVDERIVHYIDESICVGDFVLSGGEPAALTLLDSISRYVPGFMGNAESLHEESFMQEGYVEYPHYTRPAEFEGFGVPRILLSGHHGNIEKWRKEQGEAAYQKFRKAGETED